jgi:SAM-dependent methyltransferase
MIDGFWRRGWRSGIRAFATQRQFPPPRIENEWQAREVRGALERFLERDENRFCALFLGGQPLKPDDVERPWIRVLTEAGYVKPARLGAVRPCVRVFFLDGLLIATDLLTYDEEDQVFSLMLEQLLITRLMEVRKNDSVLELCLGSGVNALVAARRGAARVVGIDTSSRALAFAAANAALNLSRERGEPSLETLRGSLFEPLPAGERFDLIIINPPFEPAPSSDTEYFRHSRGGEDGLDVVRAVLPQVPDRLQPGGRFEMYTWALGDAASHRLSDLAIATLPGMRIEERRVDRLILDSALFEARNRPGYPEFRARLASQGVTYVWGIHLRAFRDEAAGLVQIDSREDVQACKPVLSRWGLWQA